MFTRYKKQMLGIVLPIFLFGFAEIAMASEHSAAAPSVPNQSTLSLADKVRHELLMLPYFGVFDNLDFTMENSDTVILTGQVVRPILKSDAEGAVKRIQGVSKVVNNIEVLPLSPYDNSIRWSTYRAIFSRPGFEKYADRAIPPLRIIVKNGNVTLVGFVGSKLDKTMAEMATRSVSGVFSVTDDLKIG
jgi:hyperosmotically inducible protein